MKAAKQIENATTKQGATPRKFSKSFVSSILGMSRKTFYDRMENDNFSAEEIKKLKDNRIIN